MRALGPATERPALGCYTFPNNRTGLLALPFVKPHNLVLVIHHFLVFLEVHRPFANRIEALLVPDHNSLEARRYIVVVLGLEALPGDQLFGGTEVQNCSPPLQAP